VSAREGEAIDAYYCPGCKAFVRTMGTVIDHILPLDDVYRDPESTRCPHCGTPVVMATRLPHEVVKADPGDAPGARGRHETLLGP
jgi:hypothetical protein